MCTTFVLDFYRFLRATQHVLTSKGSAAHAAANSKINIVWNGLDSHASFIWKN